MRIERIPPIKIRNVTVQIFFVHLGLLRAPEWNFTQLNFVQKKKKSCFLRTRGLFSNIIIVVYAQAYSYEFWRY